jgi:hypothetical protein
VPGDRWLRHQQQTLDPSVLAALLAATVHALQHAVPEIGTTIAVDVKHICAWVRENNPKETIAHRWDATHPPCGDPDCRLGAKWQGNQDGGRTKTFLWGYGTGIAATTDPHLGDVVLAEWTQPFNHQDVTWFHPLFAQTVAVLGRRPTNVAADAAFDAWHVYQTCAAHGGLAAIALNQRRPAPPFTAVGHPLCSAGQVMTPTSVFAHEDGFPAQRYQCPLLRPVRTGVTCDDPRFANGGCTKSVNLTPGGQMRRTLDRRGAAYRAIYRQRTTAERINSQATALGIERPKVRRAAGVQRLSTLTYVLINLRALQRFQTRAAAQPPPSRSTLC